MNSSSCIFLNATLLLISNFFLSMCWFLNLDQHKIAEMYKVQTAKSFF